MNHIPVKSSSLKSLAHDASTNTVVARFNCPVCKGTGESPTISGLSCEKCGTSGHTGDNHYLDVPRETFDAVVTDPESVGKAFNAKIRTTFQHKGQP